MSPFLNSSLKKVDYIWLPSFCSSCRLMILEKIHPNTAHTNVNPDPTDCYSNVLGASGHGLEIPISGGYQWREEKGWSRVPLSKSLGFKHHPLEGAGIWALVNWTAWNCYESTAQFCRWLFWDHVESISKVVGDLQPRGSKGHFESPGR